MRKTVSSVLKDVINEVLVNLMEQLLKMYFTIRQSFNDFSVLLMADSVHLYYHSYSTTIQT